MDKETGAAAADEREHVLEAAAYIRRKLGVGGGCADGDSGCGGGGSGGGSGRSGGGSGISGGGGGGSSGGGAPAAITCAIVLGSGLGGFADTLDNRVVIPYAEIPHFPRSTAPGHKGNMVFGTLANAGSPPSGGGCSGGGDSSYDSPSPGSRGSYLSYDSPSPGSRGGDSSDDSPSLGSRGSYSSGDGPSPGGRSSYSGGDGPPSGGGPPFVVCMQGRFHVYEGYTMREATIYVRALRELGVSRIILTNACGGIEPAWSVGDLMLIADHINLMGANPLVGPNLSMHGPRFPDMTHAYDLEMQAIARRAASELGIALREGVYVGVLGPSYETPAEIRAFRALGASAVGMSTVPEAIVANHCGMKACGISCITNMAAGILDQPLTEQEVIDTAGRSGPLFMRLVTRIVELLSLTTTA